MKYQISIFLLMESNLKRKVLLSNSSFVCTMLTLMVFVAIIAFTYRTSSGIAFVLCCLLICIAILVSLFYIPMSVEVTPDYLFINRALRKKSFPIKKIKEILPVSVPADALRLCGSGGFMGYWGWYKADSIGRYFAYYGRSSDCFLITLDNDKKYLLGCQESEDICNFIHTCIKPEF